MRTYVPPALRNLPAGPPPDRQIGERVWRVRLELSVGYDVDLSGCPQLLLEGQEDVQRDDGSAVREGARRPRQGGPTAPSAPGCTLDNRQAHQVTKSIHCLGNHGLTIPAGLWPHHVAPAQVPPSALPRPQGAGVLPDVCGSDVLVQALARFFELSSEGSMDEVHDLLRWFRGVCTAAAAAPKAAATAPATVVGADEEATAGGATAGEATAGEATTGEAAAAGSSDGAPTAAPVAPFAAR